MTRSTLAARSIPAFRCWARSVVATASATSPARTCSGGGARARRSCRIALASTVDRGWHRTAAMGVFGAAASAGKLLGLTAEQMLGAFGIAYSQAAGNRQCILDGALTKRMPAKRPAPASSRRCWRRPALPGRVTSSTAVSVFSSCTSPMGTMPRCYCAIWGRRSAARR